MYIPFSDSKIIPVIFPWTHCEDENSQDMRKQRQRIDEQQIMHYFVQILQAWEKYHPGIL